MREGKGSNRYAALPARAVEPVQLAYLREQFDLAVRSHLAEEVVRQTNAVLAAYEAEQGTCRVLPGELLERMTAEAWRQDGVLSMLDLEWLLNVNPALIRELLNAYREHFGSCCRQPAWCWT